MVDVTSAASLRRSAGRALVSGMCVAAAVAVLALLTGSLDHTDVRVIGTSLGFGVFSSTAAAGAAIRLRRADWAQALALATLAASFAAFALLVVNLWLATEGDVRWRVWGIAALAALGTSHASLVLRALGPSDSAAVRSLTAVSIIALGVDSAAVMLLLLEVVERVDEPLGRGLALVMILAVLSTAVLPVLRGLARANDAVNAAAPPRAAGLTAWRAGPTSDLSAEIAAVAARLDAMSATPEIRSEVARLRELARAAAGTQV